MAGAEFQDRMGRSKKDNRKKRLGEDEFPKEFTAQRIGVAAAHVIADLPPADIARYFREHPTAAKDLLHESYDKRFTPSSFIAEEGDGFRVGWFSSRLECQHVRQFCNLADAATDYLLFSIGKGRWTPSEPANLD
jgi:hypothetical protein